MDFMIALLISKSWKKNNNDFIIVLINKLTKIINKKLIKTTINIIQLKKIIIDIGWKDYNFYNSIIMTKYALFMLKFQLSLCYFLGIK